MANKTSYHCTNILGKGGFGIVYNCKKTGTTYAIKFIVNDKEDPKKEGYLPTDAANIVIDYLFE